MMKNRGTTAPPGINYTNQAGWKQRPGLEAHPTMDQSFLDLIMLE
jgi:hypothetical protein